MSMHILLGIGITAGGGSSNNNITASGGTVRDGEAFTITYAPGGLTGSTSVTLGGASCTSVVVVSDTIVTAVAPTDDLIHGASFTMSIS